jgi:hypothetical protein
MTDKQTLLALAASCEAAAGADRRILDRLDRTGLCWLWTGALDERGRGRVWHNGRLKLHHRAVWEILMGPIAEQALLCHHCDNPTCANPAHLYVGDGKTNVADMFRRNRAWQQQDPERMRDFGRASGARNDWAKGGANPKAKLLPEQVEQIRSSFGSSYQVARAFGVNASTVQRIRKGVSWTF